MDNHSDTTRFLQAVFPDWRNRAAFAGNTLKGGWYETRDLQKLDPAGDCYVSIGAFAPGAKRRDGALEVVFLVIDDVGEKVPEASVELALGRPTFGIKSSAVSRQWVYKLSAPVPVDQWSGFFDAVEALVGGKLDGPEAVHVFRLPMGVYSNQKKPDRHGFKPHIYEENPSAVLDVAPLLNSIPVNSSPRPGPSGGGDMSLDEMRKYLAKLPNVGIDRHEWQSIGHHIKAWCANDDEGFMVFDEWSEPEKYPGYNREKWVGFGAGGLKTRGGGLKEKIEKSRAFMEEVFDDGAEHPKIDTLAEGEVQFHEGEKGILLTMENAAIGLNGLGIVCRYDQFHHRVHVRWNGKDMRLTDDLVLLLRVEMNGRYGKDFGPVHIGDAIKALALKHGFNPVTDMLAEAEAAWDGVRRLDRLGPDYFHTDDTELARQCFRKVMLAAVRRARRPGCKFDQILVLESPEGWDKSTAWAVLAGEGNFSDADILGKDARAVQEELADVWIHEIADLSGLSRTDIEHVKAFASRTNDRARGAYERFLKDQPRQSIEVGTTNSDAYLLSTTGNRRFWPFKLAARVDTARLRADRMQLWGEAARAEAGGETLVLAEALWGVAAVEQEKRRAVDVWEDELHNLVDMPAGAIAPVGFERIEDWNGDQYISNLSVQTYLKDDRRITLHPGAGRKIADIMKRLGWDRCSRTVNGATARGYKRARTAPVSVTVTKPVTQNPF